MFLVIIVDIATTSAELVGCDGLADELFEPCYCVDNGGSASDGRRDIICDEKSYDQNIDLVNIFQKLHKNMTKSEKHFNRFRLKNRFITELKENTFKRHHFR